MLLRAEEQLKFSKKRKQRTEANFAMWHRPEIAQMNYCQKKLIRKLWRLMLIPPMVYMFGGVPYITLGLSPMQISNCFIAQKYSNKIIERKSTEKFLLSSTQNLEEFLEASAVKLVSIKFSSIGLHWLMTL